MAFTFFYGMKSPFSQWHPCSFALWGRTFGCAEQAMMYGKAMLFLDGEYATRIMATDSPKEQKRLGRLVRGFDENTWKGAREAMIRDINLAKFTQNPTLREALLATAGTRMVEASPRDRVWGIGMGASNVDARNPEKWRGLNLLGNALDTVRSQLSA